MRHGATVNVKPVMIRRGLRPDGGLPLPKRGPERQAYRLAELARWRDHLKMPLNLQPAHFPAPDLRGACLVLATAAAGGDALALANALGKAMWAEDKNIAEEDTLASALAATGLDAGLLEGSKDPAYEARSGELTEEAIGAAAFSAPPATSATASSSGGRTGSIFWIARLPDRSCAQLSQRLKIVYSGAPPARKTRHFGQMGTRCPTCST